ncbi:small acid-soluble spore protein P [Salipaludibacillus sp. HK11]
MSIIEKNTFKSQRSPNPKDGHGHSGQPEPMKGTQKTRKQNRKGQTDGEG